VGDRRLENVGPTPTAGDLRTARLEIDANKLLLGALRACGRQARGKGYPRGTWGQLVRGTVEVQVAGSFRCRGIQNPHVLEAEPLAPNYLGALGDQHGYSLVW